MVTLITYFTNSTEEFELRNKKLKSFSVVFGSLLQWNKCEWAHSMGKWTHNMGEWMHNMGESVHNMGEWMYKKDEWMHYDDKWTYNLGKWMHP